MSVGRRLLAIVLVVALVPLGVVVATSVRIHERAFDRKLAELHHETARHGADSVHRSLDSARRNLGALARTIPWGLLADDERQGALSLVFAQLEDVVVSSLLDERGGGIGASVYEAAGTPEARHPTVDLRGLDAIGRAIPMAAVHRDGWALSAPLAVPGLVDPVVVLGFAVDQGQAPPGVLVVGLSLRSICHDLAAASPDGVTTRLLDAEGSPLCPGASNSAGELLSTVAATPAGWQVVVVQPASRAFVDSRRLRRQLFAWVGLATLTAIAAGLLMTRAFRRRLRELAIGADAVATGDRTHRVPEGGSDEFGTLAQGFNRMSAELQRQEAELLAWNQELQQRVEARTRELEAAQQQLLQSRKLAAMAALGAGLAHEINNPLTGVLGLTQVLATRQEIGDRDRRVLGSIEKEAVRIREIVDRMRMLSQDFAAGAGLLQVNDVVEAAVAAHLDRLTQSGVEVVREYGSTLAPVLGNPGQLQQAFSQLIDNAIKAMAPNGGSLRVRTHLLGSDLIGVDVTDSGRGMPSAVIDKNFEPFFTTKDDWQGKGLGLAVTHRIIDSHHGRIQVRSAPGDGTTMTVTLPTARRGAHLA